MHMDINQQHYILYGNLEAIVLKCASDLLKNEFNFKKLSPKEKNARQFMYFLNSKDNLYDISLKGEKYMVTIDRISRYNLKL